MPRPDGPAAVVGSVGAILDARPPSDVRAPGYGLIRTDQGERRVTTDDDRVEIMRLHREWIESNTGLDIERMRKVFPEGDAYLMYNCNGHPYYGIDEKVAVWRHLQGVMEYRMLDEFNHRLEIRGDMAFLACEGYSEFDRLQEEGRLDGYHWRATEVYIRDDGSGKPQWRMWHYHCSHHAPDDASRPGFGDTAMSRDRRKPRGIPGELSGGLPAPGVRRPA